MAIAVIVILLAVTALAALIRHQAGKPLEGLMAAIVTLVALALGFGGIVFAYDNVSGLNLGQGLVSNETVLRSAFTTGLVGAAVAWMTVRRKA